MNEKLVIAHLSLVVFLLPIKILKWKDGLTLN
jgi:hypothetical protein